MTGITISMRGVETLSKSEVNACVRLAMEAVGWEWRQKYLPKRFTKAGAREYGFRKRQGEDNPQKRGTYTNRKLHWFHHTLPLRFTSESMKEALFGLRVVKASATSRGATVRIQLPRRANHWIKEWTAVSAPEQLYLQKFLAGRLSLELQKAGARKTFVTVTIGGGQQAAA